MWEKPLSFGEEFSSRRSLFRIFIFKFSYIHYNKIIYIFIIFNIFIFTDQIWSYHVCCRYEYFLSFMSVNSLVAVMKSLKLLDPMLINKELFKTEQPNTFCSTVTVHDNIKRL